MWAFFAKRPRLYGLATAAAARLLAWAGRARGRFCWLPLASGWTRYRDFPAPQGETFQSQWKHRNDRPSPRPGDPPLGSPPLGNPP
jgi:L-lactate dehydrogenase complex protein LldF